MRRTTLILSLCLLLTLLFALQFSAAPLLVRVHEKGASLDLDAGRTVVSLPVENVSGREIATHVRLELVDTDGDVIAEGETRNRVPAGAHELRLQLPFDFKDLDAGDRKEFPFYRLRYRVAAGDSEREPSSVTEGVISLSEITPELFELRVSAARRAREGTRYRVRVQAAHPITGRPVHNVQLNGEIELEGAEAKKAVLQATCSTDAEGDCALDFNLPAKVSDEEADITVTGRLKVFEQRATATVDFDTTAQLLLTTDKSLYQPGQTLHLRALAFDPSRRALSSASAAFEVEDPDGTTVFRASSTTTRFGVATADWQIPENTPLGEYSIKVRLDEGRYEDSYAQQLVKISRYDLPNFTVNTKADRAYYLPGRNAEVEVRADYLFGQPVKQGRVRVVRETERQWNFKEQKWETEEGEVIEGTLDAAGRFVARIDLQEAHKELAENSYWQFKDISYAAYLTDPTTNRTEQRRFDLRVTKDPIHIYVAEGSYSQAHGLPLSFYVTASYADGTPAECELSVQVAESAYGIPSYYNSYASLPSTTSTRPATVAVVKTNRYGVAKVTGPPVPLETDSSRYLSVKLSARDRAGRTGQHEESFWLSPESRVRVETDKAVYRAGEPVRVRVMSNKQDALAYVDVVSDLKVIRSEAVRLEGGRASITLPYGKDFDGRLSIIASLREPGESQHSSDDVVGRRSIIYPRDRELRLDVRTGQAVYRPGEEAEATLRAVGTDGRPLESVFGVVVFDKAVEERARTDGEFNSVYGFYNYFHSFRYGSGAVAGFTLRDIERLDLKRKPVPEDLNLVADILLQHVREYEDYERTSFETDTYEKNQSEVFGPVARDKLAPLKKALDARYEQRAEYPATAEALRRFLKEAQLDFDQLRDPWNMNYRAAFSVMRESDVLEITSAGADKQFGTRDDFTVQKFAWAYFRALGERIDGAVNAHHARTQGFIRDEATLIGELARAGITRDQLRDRWGEPYRFEFGSSGVLLSIKIRSGGPDRRFEEKEIYGSDDFTVWTTWIDSFAGARAQLDAALNAYLRATGKFPHDETAFRDALKRAGIERDSLRDPWGRVYSASFKSESRYVDRVVIESRYSSAGPEKRANIVPISQRVYLITLFSAGADLRGGTGDDFQAATFTSIAFEQSAADADAKQVQPLTTFAGATGAIAGTITDPNGSAVPGATVIAVNTYNSAEQAVTSNDEGVYIVRNLAPGRYKLTVTAAGFSTYSMTDVPVRSAAITKVDVSIQPGSITETVTVTAGAETAVLNTTSATVSKVVSLVGLRRGQLSTPRLREYFPETLVWEPAVETDAEGRASLRFKLADNITTWKLSVIGSTVDGEIGTAEKEIRAFQPFFVEHDPPRILTEGDEIDLPVVLRNYLDREQAVDLEMKPESWFSIMGQASQRARVKAGDASREVFQFRASSSVKDGRQRITALGLDASDAIEKPVTVHPDGEERAETDSRVFTDSATLETEIPTEAIKGTVQGELKIYPNLVGHVIESIEGIMARPYGCGEQTISSTYPSLLVLIAYKRNGTEPPEKIAARARRYLQSGYERLLNYRAESGGFSYWGGRSEPNLALTAYALRFLSDAREFIEVDEEVTRAALEWLVKEQRSDGSWPAYTYGGRESDAASPMTTALIARTLALYEKGGTQGGAQQGKTPREALRQALAFLERRSQEMDEPYLLASYALAALEAGEHERAARATERLRRMAKTEGDAAYWALETNTPFYGWGLAGRIETTALVLQALARSSKAEGRADVVNAKDETDALVSSGLLFLLKRKDRYGVWYSTQATVNVLDALIALLSSSQVPGDNAPGAALVRVNGKLAGTIQLPPAGQLSAPLTLNLSKFLSAGSNRIEITRAGGSPARASAQVVSNYYLPWPKALADETKRKGASALRLAVSFDKTEVSMTNEVTCSVRAERVGFGGYGMLLAEIGLPPGADVDRASLERAMKESGWSFTRYDILPDRLVVYLWPRSGGTDFQFKFRPRFGLKALTAPSVLYDYYNPEAHTVLAPVRFIVK